jgi:hypothetical protein
MTIDERPAKRIQKEYKQTPLYVLLTYDEDGGPYAVQFSISSAEFNADQKTLSNLDALARMTTLALREYETDYVIASLLETSRGETTIAGILADVLMEFGQG